MRLNLSAKSARNFRKSTKLAALIGVVIGLIIVASVPSLHVLQLWILMPIIMGFAFGMSVVGFYLIFLNK